MNGVDENNTAASASDLWHVQLPNGDVLIMTLDQLDDAFQKGVIHERSHVLQYGTTTWSTLAAVAGLDEPEDRAAVQAPAPSHAIAQPVAQPVAAPKAAVVAPTSVSVPLSVPPSGLHSVRPVVADFADIELDELQFKPKKRRGRTFVVALLAVACGVGFYAFRFGVPTQVTALAAQMGIVPSQTVAAVPEPAAAPAAPPPVATPVSAPAPAATTEAKDARLTDEQRRTLMEADKNRASKRKVRSPAPRSGTKRPKGPPVFHAGHDPGDHDPLNSSL